MGLTAFPTIVFNSGTGSDTAASGAGPATAITGTCAASTASTTVTFNGSPDLSGVATDGTHVLFVSGRGFVRIDSVDNVAKTCVVETALTIAASTAFAIGGKRATLNHTESRRLLAATASPNASGASGQWTVSLEDDQTITSALAVSFTIGTGELLVTMDGTTRRTITQTTSNALMWSSTVAHRIRFRGIVFRHSGATRRHAFSAINVQPSVVFDNCIIGSPDGTNCPAGASVNISGVGARLTMINTSVLRCAGAGISGNHARVQLLGSEISRCDGAAAGVADSGMLILKDSIISYNGGNGLETVSPPGFLICFVTGCTFHGNAGSGILLTAANQPNGVVIANNNFTANGAFGIDFSGSGPHDANVEHNNFGTGATANTSGAVNGFAKSSTNLDVDPAYADASDAVRNFAVGVNLRAAGFPASSVTMAAGQTGSTSYVDIGAVQREEPAGGGGGTRAWIS